MNNPIDNKSGQENFYDNLPCGYFSSLPNGIINSCNSVLLSHTGYHKEEVINVLRMQDFLTTGGKIYMETHYSPLLHFQGSIKEINFDFVRKDGIKFPVLVNSMRVTDDSANHILTHHTVFNITQRKKYESELFSAKTQSELLAENLLQLNKELNEKTKLVTGQKEQLLNFAHLTSHNLRSPVGNLNSLLDLYNQATSIEDKAFLFTKFEKVIHHLSDTLNELLESLKIQEDSGRKLEKVSFADILNKTEELFAGEIMESNVVVTSDFLEADQIEYSRLYLESIILNLFSNAIKYRSSDRKPSIHFQTKSTTKGVSLTVTDNGLGIDLKQYRKQLFGLNKTFHKHKEAKGVGLFITKSQVEAMGGSISAESDVNKGTTFKIEFSKKSKED